jgi:hypothetical protein
LVKSPSKPLVNSKKLSTCPHNHIQPLSTWNHVRLVVKNAHHTTKQTKKNNATTKHSLPLKQTYDRIKTIFLTQRTKNACPSK